MYWRLASKIYVCLIHGFCRVHIHEQDMCGKCHRCGHAYLLDFEFAGIFDSAILRQTKVSFLEVWQNDSHGICHTYLWSWICTPCKNHELNKRKSWMRDANTSCYNQSNITSDLVTISSHDVLFNQSSHCK